MVGGKGENDVKQKVSLRSCLTPNQTHVPQSHSRSSARERRFQHQGRRAIPRVPKLVAACRDVVLRSCRTVNTTDVPSHIQSSRTTALGCRASMTTALDT